MPQKFQDAASHFLHSRLCILLTLSLFALAYFARQWNETIQYRTYLSLGCALALLTCGPYVADLFHRKPH